MTIYCSSNCEKTDDVNAPDTRYFLSVCFTASDSFTIILFTLFLFMKKYIADFPIFKNRSIILLIYDVLYDLYQSISLKLIILDSLMNKIIAKEKKKKIKIVFL